MAARVGASAAPTNGLRGTKTGRPADCISAGATLFKFTGTGTISNDD